MSTWFQRQRLVAIRKFIEHTGSVRRRHLAAHFDVTLQTITADINEFKRKWPKVIYYDNRAKHYTYTERELFNLGKRFAEQENGYYANMAEAPKPTAFDNHPQFARGYDYFIQENQRGE